MKKRLKQLILAFSLILVTLVIAACQSDPYGGSSYEQGTSDTYDEASVEIDTSAPDLIESNEDQKVVSYASVDFESNNFEKSKTALFDAINEYNGRVQVQNQYMAESSLGNRGNRLELEVHIETEVFQDFMQSLEDSDLLYLKNQTIDSSDVSQSYLSRQTQIEVLKEEEALIRADLEGMTEVDDHYKSLQRNLLNVLTQIETLEREQEEVDDRVTYVPVHITILEVDRVSRHKVEGFWQRIWHELTNAFYRLLILLSDLVVLIIRLIPFVIVLGLFALIIWGIVYLVRKIRPKREPNEKATLPAETIKSTGPTKGTKPTEQTKPTKVEHKQAFVKKDKDEETKK